MDDCLLLPKIIQPMCGLELHSVFVIGVQSSRGVEETPDGAQANEIFRTIVRHKRVELRAKSQSREATASFKRLVNYERAARLRKAAALLVAEAEQLERTPL